MRSSLSLPLPLAVPLAVVLLASPAGAAPTAALSLTPSKPAGAATTCLSLTVNGVDAVGSPATDTPTVVISLAATGTARTSFCDPATGAPSGAAEATASTTLPTGSRFGVTSTQPGAVTVVAATATVRSATATATFSDPPPPECGPAPGLAVAPGRVVAGQAATATVTAAPGTQVQLYAYSRPSTTYRLVRQAVVPSTGSASFPFRAPGSTRLYAVQRYCTLVSPSGLLQVASPVSASVRRLRPLSYRFSGATGGAPAGTPVALVHRTAAGDVVLARTTTDAAGRWTLDRGFSRPARLPLYARTSPTAARLAGSSPVRTVVVQ